MNKRGQGAIIELAQLIDIIIGVLAATIILIAAVSWNNLTNFNKIYLENDLKLITNSVMSSPNSIRVHYPLSQDYKIEIKDRIKIAHEPMITNLLKDSWLVMQLSKESRQIDIWREP